MARNRWMVLVLLVAIAAFFRLWHLHTIPPGLFPDEAMNGNNIHEALRTGNYKIFYRENNGREGLFINLQAISVYFLGHTPFALRLVAALFGILTVAALYFFTAEYTGNIRTAVFATFFIATSFWHIDLSRLGFRANIAPFFLTASLAYFYYIWNRRRDRDHVKILVVSFVGGILFGLGFHSYIAYRAAPLVALPGMLLFLDEARTERGRCILCLPALYIFGALVAALPLGLYFAHNPQDFFGRASEISIFSQPHPARLFLENFGKTIQMFFFVGDYNWRHNYAGAPELWWPVAIFFVIGIIDAIKKKYWTLFLWFLGMMLPVVISSEGIPHALRSIIIIPPVLVFAGLGLERLLEDWQTLLGQAKTRYREAARIIQRIEKWTLLLVVVVLGAVAVHTYNEYFQKWAVRPETHDAFTEYLANVGYFLKSAPLDIKKYVLTDESAHVDRTGSPMAVEPILFITETYLPEPTGAKNIYYVTTQELDSIDCGRSCLVIPIRNIHTAGSLLKSKFPFLKLEKQGDILVYTR